MCEIKKNSRIDWIDIAKGYGILFVILGHIEIPHIVIKRIIYSFHLPLFFFLSGYVFSANMLDFKSFLKKKIRSILKPYFTLGLVLLIYSYIQMIIEGNINLEDYGMLLVEFIIQRRLWTLWFLACLFFLNILFFFLKKFLSEKQLAIFSCVIPILGFLYYKTVGFILPWNIDICFVALPFFYVGNKIKELKIMDYIEALRLDKKIYIFIIFLILNLISVYTNLQLTGKTLEMYHTQYGNPLIVYLSAFCGIFCVIIFSLLFDLGLIKFIGRNSILYFALHKTIIIPFVEKIFNHSIIVNNTYYTLLSKIVIILLMNTIIILLIDKANLKRKLL